MATRKYLSLSGLQEYDSLLKSKISTDDAATLSSSKSYTDQKFNAIMGTGAADTLNTIGEISDALKDNAGIIDTLATKTSLDTHDTNTTKHITSTERTNWNSAKTHSTSAHAPSNAEKNQNAFSNVSIGDAVIAADSPTDTLKITGSNVTLAPNTTDDSLSIGITKANVVAALGYTPQTSGSYAAASHSHGDLYYTESEIDTKLEGKANSNHSHSAATTSAAGFMTADMVTKLNGIASGANKITVDSALSSTSTNPVQNKVVNTAISSLNTTVSSHTTSIASIQAELDEIEEITSQDIQNLFSST